MLKNAIDWTSRPWGKNSWAGKTVLLAGVSVGKVGTALAQAQVKDVLLYLDANVMGQPELYLGPAMDLFEVSTDAAKVYVDAPTGLKDAKTKEFLAAALTALAQKVKKNKNG